ncbi:MAG TPA: membrane protein insertase YidC [Bacteroidales bacterium]|nr:membrane protein insertase YidC [Bacteroidales bacterium]
MDKNTITGLILIFLIFIGFSIYNNARLNKIYNEKVTLADSLYKAGSLEKARTEYINALNIKPNQPDIILKLNDINLQLGLVQPDSLKNIVEQKEPEKVPAADLSEPAEGGTASYGIFSGSASGANDFITLENNLLELKISLKGGRIYSARLKEYRTYDSLPLILFDGDSTVFGFNFFTADNKPVQTNDLFFKFPSEERHFIVTDKPQSVKLYLYADSNKYIEYTYTLSPGKYTVDFNASFVSMSGVVAQNQNTITLDWRMYIPQKEKSRQSEESYTTVKYKYYQDEVDGIKERSRNEIEKVDIPTRLSWVAFKDQFFSSVIITDRFFQNGTFSSTRLPASEKYIKYFTAEIGVPFVPSNPEPLQFKFYLGPNHFSTLKKEGYELEQIVTLGKNITRWINQYLIIPIFNWLNRYISNYGIIILILTIIIKIILFPLTFKSYQAQAKMMVLKPLVDEIAKKYPKQEDAMKRQQATMELYKRAGINPLGGCLPTLLQFPILYAMFRFFPTSIELRQEPFLWAKDLSTYDSILNLPFTIPLYGDHVSLFTLLMTASTIITMKMSGSTSGQDQPGMKVMMYMMPVMFMLILNNFSAGLTYYYFLANVLSYIQNLVSKRFINQEEILAKIEESKKKPLKKSKWQQRLEEAAKARGINPPKK